jgi:non-canonical (house-cleaning) NTP pyrophosphatase
MKNVVVDEAFRPAAALLRALGGDPVRVGSRNAAKLGAVRAGLGAFAPAVDDLLLIGVEVASGVPDQPIGWSQIVRGARTRARAAFASGDCALGVGIEDGLVRLAGDGDAPAGSAPGRGPDEVSAGIGAVYNVGCAWLTDGEREGHGFSSAFAYPPDCLEPAFRDQAPIGDLFDALWRERRGDEGRAPGSPEPPGPANPVPSGRQGGNIGLLTRSRLDRSAYGAQAVICALVPFLHTDLYD